jgi:thiol-disulfide isomerase/thioredoxin
MSDESMTDESMTDESMTDESMSDESMTDESMTDESMSDESMSDESMSDESMSDESMTDESMSDESTSVESTLAAWQTLPITDVDGQTFTFAELVGTPVVLEFFATWCPKCRSQLADTNAAAATLEGGATVIALSVETDLSSQDVADYAADNGFDSIRFAVMTPELLAAVVDAFGQSAANPPSTPKVVIDAMGHAGKLTTGTESADELVAAVRAGA